MSETDKIFAEFLRAFFLAKEYYAHPKGTREKSRYLIQSLKKKYPANTWDDYCKEIGISRQTANKWLRIYTWQDTTQPIRPPAPAGFAAAVWWLNRQKKKRATEVQV